MLSDYLAAIALGINLLLLIVCLAAICYYCYGIYAAIEFFSHEIQIDSDFHPPITILKPICGLDIDTYENFASFCQQDYPEYQIIFGVRDGNDPSVQVVKKIIEDFPEIDISLVISDRIIGTNLKVSNLANAEAKAKYSLLLLADSDVRVGRDYLQRVIQPMRDPEVGVVTCLYRPFVRGWVAILEAVGISTEYHASILVARSLEGMNFALGPTIAIRKSVLEAIGGFVAIADYLADDFQLGYLPTQVGYKVVLSDYVIDHAIATVSLLDLIHRQKRWNCCTRVSRPWGYLGLIFTHGTAMSLLFLIATTGSIFGWAIAFLTLSIRLIMAWVVGVKSLKDPVASKFLWLIPLRDIISFAIWCYGFFGSTIEWRGQRLQLTKDGKLVIIPFATQEVLPS
ncbi:putative glycosyl transferase, group 2 family protein [Tolypothrix sp. NIES-4075]|uniref:bacteriohopanetetrol glucosamine biosynthesis glycosyltransferase HpnI n=1 Tax=Tolypothrix sp. NIES-4075 TaxID=2005459 RepID=UPI000B5C2571|nr:bacteriohopanetetrol glucosamine biosynthesis glycosyltransferase HpnI [Tolypothrix sp. NIES-4075]GAX41691.1 putative glycosyl transferase, group 2 family protein [Tolypothrix sp. NIES-4075]